jgi:glycosyltransferase involved in cell wall biosynthesis
MKQNYQPGTQNNYVNFSPIIPVTENKKEFFIESVGGGKGTEATKWPPDLQRETLLREPLVPPKMKIILVGPGLSPIPPTGWGAIESLIWDYYENLTKFGIDVNIINNSDLNEVVRECNKSPVDAVHIMYDDYVVIAPYLACRNIIYTSHYAYITSPDLEKTYKYYYQNIFMRAIENQRHIKLHALSDKIADVYQKHGLKSSVRIICNGARDDLFRFTSEPLKADRSVYVAKIEFRKAQYKYQSIDKIDFVGNYFNSPFFTNEPNYLGEWSKATLYENLTEYGNLVLLSDGEADPLVVKEALIAGLGVVVSECSSANLDLTKPFITVIPDDRLSDLEYVSRRIEENRRASVATRDEIRKYALENFAWNSIIKKYLEVLRTSLFNVNPE